jgi:hypothetical protein
MLYTIYRDTVPIHTTYPTGQQEREIMTKDVVSFAFSSPTSVSLQIGDYIDVHGQRYELALEPEATKDSTLNYRYDCEFVAEYYKLSKWKMRGLDSTNALTLPEWELQGTLTDFLEIAVGNANRMSTGWTVGDVQPGNTQKYLSFTSDNNILNSLSQIAQAFETEWWVVGRTIHLIKRQEVSGHEFEYGYNMGLRGGIRRIAVDSQNVFSRLLVQGSEQNIPSTYRNGARRLQLPIGTPYLQGVKYGPDEIEADVIFDDIRPERIGIVTSTGGIQEFTDTGIDFDINSQLLPGISAKISFLTGNLSGYNFEIAKGGYDHTTRTVKFVTNEQEKGNILPDADRKPEIGDTYFFFDIVMPDSYVQDAQNRLLAKGQEHMAKNGVPKFTYDLPPDHFFFERNSTLLTLGDTVHVKELDLGLDSDIRIIGYTRDLHDVYKYSTMLISDITPMATIVRQYTEADKTKKAMAANKLNDIQRARANWRTTNELTTMLDTIRAEMLLIMVEGGSYQTNIISETNVENNPNAFRSTAGVIVHEEYLIPGTWNIAASNHVLPTNDPYYVYIKAARSNVSATVELSTSKLAAESDPNFYYFPFGILSTPYLNKRILTSIKGYTRITGSQINTGKIVSNSGESFLDLDLDQFFFGDDTSGIDWNYTNPGKLTIKGGLIQSGSGIVSPLPVYRGAYNPLVSYYKGDTVSYSGSTWIFINDSAISGQTPADNQYWDIVANKGTDGIGTPGSNGVTTYTWVKYGDSATTGMSDNPSGKKWIGLAFNKTTQIESSVYADYTWSLISGADGTSVRILGTKTTEAELPTTGNTDGDGYTIDGDLYVWAAGVWSNVGRIKGDDGTNGTSSYIHVKYSNDGGVTFTQDGGEYPGSYIGVYTDTIQADGLDVDLYTWTRIQGADGNDGSSGSNGVFTEQRFAVNGSTTTAPSLNIVSNVPAGWSLFQPAVSAGQYLWMTSAQKSPLQVGRNLMKDSKLTSLTGWGVNGGTAVIEVVNGENVIRIESAAPGNGIFSSNMSRGVLPNTDYTISFDIKGILYFPSNTLAIGINALTHEVIAPNTDVWTRVSYTVNSGSFSGDSHVVIFGTSTGDQKFYIKNMKIQIGKIADSWSPAPEDPDYFVYSNLLGTWSSAVRINAKDGVAGEAGPFLANQGNYDPTRTYIGNALQIQSVKYNGLYYFTRTDAGSFTGILPTNTSKWNAAGSQFDSIATGLLLAQLAYIENLGVRNLATETTGHKRVVIDGDNNNLRVYNSANQVLIEIDDDSAFGGLPGIRAGILGQIYATLGSEGFYAINTFSGQRAYLRPDGFYTDGPADIGGDISIGGDVTINGVPGLSKRIAYSLGSTVYHMTFVNGILTENGTGA